MRLIRGLHNLHRAPRPCVVSIGNFDGVHVGHQAVLTDLVAHSRALGVPAAAVVFEPQPDEFFSPQPPARLSTLRDKAARFAQLGLDVLVCLHFNRALAQMPAETFIDRLLVRGLAARHVVVGPDFRFGQGRRGDVALLCAAGVEHGFSVATIAPFLLDGQRVSSTAVRAALAQGDLAQATRLLGRPYTVQGRVTHGDARGRTLGFPTANLRVRGSAPAARGVYAAWVEGIADRALPAVVNSGLRPTVNGALPLIEVHVLDFRGDLYGRRIRVRLAHHLRAERRFESLDALRAQITADADAARACLADGPDR